MLLRQQLPDVGTHQDIVELPNRADAGYALFAQLVDWLHGHVLIPGFETAVKRRRTFAHWRELEKSQWLPRDQIVALRPVTVSSDDYAWREYGATPEELARFEKRMEKQVSVERKRGRIKHFTGNLEKDLTA